MKSSLRGTVSRLAARVRANLLERRIRRRSVVVAVGVFVLCWVAVIAATQFPGALMVYFGV